MAGRAGPSKDRKARAPEERGRREEILAAAVESVTLDGYARTSMSQVARRAGVPRPLVQYYFPTLDLLLRAAIEAISEGWRRAYFEQARTASSDAPISISEGVDRLWAHMHDPLYRAYQELLSAARTDTALAAMMRDLHRAGTDRRRAAAREAYASYAEIDAETFVETSEFTAIFLEGLLLHRFGEDDEDQATSRQLRMLKAVLASYWAEHGLPKESAPDTRPPAPAVAPDLADLARQLIVRLEPLAYRK